MEGYIFQISLTQKIIWKVTLLLVIFGFSEFRMFQVQQDKVMLKRGKIVFQILAVTLALSACNERGNKNLLSASIKNISQQEYNRVYKLLLDTISNRRANNLDYYVERENKNEYSIDSLI